MWFKPKSSSFPPLSLFFSFSLKVLQDGWTADRISPNQQQKSIIFWQLNKMIRCQAMIGMTVIRWPWWYWKWWQVERDGGVPKSTFIVSLVRGRSWPDPEKLDQKQWVQLFVCCGGGGGRRCCRVFQIHEQVAWDAGDRQLASPPPKKTTFWFVSTFSTIKVIRKRNRMIRPNTTETNQFENPGKCSFLFYSPCDERAKTNKNDTAFLKKWRTLKTSAAGKIRLRKSKFIQDK